MLSGPRAPSPAPFYENGRRGSGQEAKASIYGLFLMTVEMIKCLTLTAEVVLLIAPRGRWWGWGFLSGKHDNGG
jgi:hypothetical protein